jgi:hypothetical protein
MQKRSRIVSHAFSQEINERGETMNAKRLAVPFWSMHRDHNERFLWPSWIK